MEQDAPKSDSLSGLYRKLHVGRRFLVHILTRFHRDGCFAAAGALSYTTLVSLVPLLVIALAIISAFPLFNRLRDNLLGILFNNFVPQVGSTVDIYISLFTASAGKTTAIGLVVFAATGIILLATIEDRLDAIWKVHAPRRWIVRLLIYWTVTTLGPFLFAAAVSLSNQLASISGKIGLASGIERHGAVLLKPLGFVITGGAEAIALMFLYCLIPHCPVRWRDGLLGGVVAAVVLEICKLVFSLYLTHFTSYEVIYGALAVIPIFLLWMYLSWTIILFGAEIAAAIPNWQVEEADMVPPANNLELGLAILHALFRQQKNGGGLTPKWLAKQLNVPVGILADCLDRLGRAGWIICGISGGWVLARDLTTITLAELETAVQASNPARYPLPNAPIWRYRLADAFDMARTAEQQALTMRVADIVTAGDQPGL